MIQHRRPAEDDTPGLVVCTCPSQASAEGIATRLVEEELAASVNVVAGIRSTYRWQGRVQRADEHLLLVKTVAGRYASVERAIVEEHPYELPQILWVTIDSGSSDYLDWIRQSVRPR